MSGVFLRRPARSPKPAGVDAFIYLRVQPGRVEDVVVQLQATKGIRAAVTVIGDWDVMAAAQRSRT